MPYGLPELKTPDIAGAYAQGSAWKEAKDERARKQPIIEQLEKLNIRKGEQAIAAGERNITLKDMAIANQKEKEQQSELDDLSAAANWVQQQPEENRGAAFKQVTDFYGSQGHDVSMFEGRDDLIPFLAGINKPGGVEKFGRAFEGVGEDGVPGFYQTSQSGKMRRAEGARPLTFKEKATGAGLKAAAQDKAKLSVKAAQDAFEQVVTIDAGITLLDEGIAALEGGADVGILDKFAPSIKESSVRFDNVARRMGLQVVSSVTFGALSQGELELAMDTAVPKSLDDKQLIKWFRDRKAAQTKLRGFYIDIARQASEEGKTPAEIMIGIEAKKKSSKKKGGGKAKVSASDIDNLVSKYAD